MKKILFILVFLFVVLIGGFSLYLGDLVKRGVSSFGSQRAGVEMRLADFSLVGLSGFRAKGLFVGNPKGFSSESAIKLDNISIIIDIASLMTDTIVIREIRINAPEITYEVTPTGTNLNQISANITAESNKLQQNTDGSGQKNRGEKKIIIDDLYVTGGKITLVTGVGDSGQGAPIILPDIHLKNLGKEAGGNSISETTRYILQIIAQNAAKVNIGSVKNMLGNMENIGKGSIDSLKGLVKGIKLPLGE